VNVFALEFPPVSHLFDWPDILFSGSLFAVNKTVLIYLAAVLITSAIFLTAGKQRNSLVPVGVQHVAESGVNFVEESVVMETIGPEGKKYLPFLTTMFFFILFSNIFEVVPGIQFPANSRMAVPITLALVVWVIYNFVGVRSQGIGGYLKNSLFPPGVPKALYLIVTPIELVSTFVVRPFSLAIRLWANMVAGTANSFERYCKMIVGSRLSALGKSIKFLRIVFLPSQVTSTNGNSNLLTESDFFEIFFSILLSSFS